MSLIETEDYPFSHATNYDGRVYIYNSGNTLRQVIHMDLDKEQVEDLLTQLIAAYEYGRKVERAAWGGTLRQLIDKNL